MAMKLLEVSLEMSVSFINRIFEEAQHLRQSIAHRAALAGRFRARLREINYDIRLQGNKGEWLRGVVQSKHEPHVILVSANRRFHSSGIAKRVVFCCSERTNQ
jgi:hypothetical protein